MADELIADIFGSSDEEEEFAVSFSLLLLLFPLLFVFFLLLFLHVLLLLYDASR